MSFLQSLRQKRKEKKILLQEQKKLKKLQEQAKKEKELQIANGYFPEELTDDSFDQLHKNLQKEHDSGFNNTHEEQSNYSEQDQLSFQMSSNRVIEKADEAFSSFDAFQESLNFSNAPLIDSRVKEEKEVSFNQNGAWLPKTDKPQLSQKTNKQVLESITSQAQDLDEYKKQDLPYVDPSLSPSKQEQKDSYQSVFEKDHHPQNTSLSNSTSSSVQPTHQNKPTLQQKEDKEVQSVTGNEKNYNKPDYSTFQSPPVAYLEKVLVDNKPSEETVRSMASLLVQSFNNFKVSVTVENIEIGPRITRFSILPATGVRVSSLLNLDQDIALGMGVKDVRMEVVPPYVAVEVPNYKSTTVSLRSLIESPEFRSTKTLMVPLGVSVTGDVVFSDISKFPHLLVAGATGMGKSVFINCFLLSLLYKARPDDVKLILVDPKRVELAPYAGIPHLLIPPVIDMTKAAGALIWAQGEMERRYNLMVATGSKNIESYNQTANSQPERFQKLPYIIIVIDELHDLMLQAKDAIDPVLNSLAAKARAAGIHLIIGTQRPSVDVITGTIKANVPSRIAFHVSSNVDSRTILDAQGAEKLLNAGDMLACVAGQEVVRLQGAYVSEPEIDRVTNYLKENAQYNVYDNSINELIEQETNKLKAIKEREKPDDDEEDVEFEDDIFEDSTFIKSCDVAFSTNRMSTSLLKRKLGIGYSKAAHYMDIMEEMKIIGPADGSKPREVLMSRDQFYEMMDRERANDDDYSGMSEDYKDTTVDNDPGEDEGEY